MTASKSTINQLSKRAIIVWLSACGVYIVAVTGRTSFGIAGVFAIDRFHIDASRLAFFTSVQLGVYAISQIPVGLLIDRYGARRILLLGALVMTSGQFILGIATTYPLAISARILIGAGDATAFLSVLRLLPVWFPARVSPLFAQLTGCLGQIGQFLSAVPFLWLLNTYGWSISFISLAAVGVLISFAAVIFVSNTRAEPRVHFFHRTRESIDQPGSATPTRTYAILSHVIKSPLVWRALFIHWTNMAPLNVFLLLWGTPTMTLGMNFTAAQVGIVFTCVTISTIIAGFGHGFLSARLSHRRDIFASSTAGINITCLTLLYVIPTTPPRPVTVIMLVICASLLIPSANYGFDSIREKMPLPVLATATGFANMGGFTAVMLSAQIMGALLDSRGGYSWPDFRYAWTGLLLVWIIGIIGFCVAHWKITHSTTSEATT
ncbi:sugar phosphate permease [Corynebacterium kutscheri]|uniref:Sugar phosphate permease n=1 Tax=Corynebacterium kutscheri TaxID=35755 RepID=A0A0F6R1F3_9CORY|nr:MFS transporter [Corynebacterium kutscheri]AKE40983.1 sugar phosphate permease [Corynebacterium kutscheri]VEH09281.1 galactarate transporter [Corynebacterium kutscheri]